ELIEKPFLRAPVVLIPPVGDQFLEVLPIGSVVPATSGDFVREARLGQPLFQINEHSVGHLDLERNDLCRLRGFLGAARGLRRHQRSDAIWPPDEPSDDRREDGYCKSLSHRTPHTSTD